MSGHCQCPHFGLIAAAIVEDEDEMRAVDCAMDLDVDATAILLQKATQLAIKQRKMNVIL